MRQFFRRHRFTFTTFSVIGVLVFGFGLAGLYVQVHWFHIDPQLAFLLQGFLSIEASYFLNWKLTWHKRQSRWWTSFKRFHLMRLVTIPINQIIYFGLIQLGMQYLLAALGTTAIFTIVNYGFCHLWAFPARFSYVDLGEEM